MNKQIDNLIKELAIKYNITESSVDRIINSQFRFLSNEMSSKECNPIMLTHIGKWYVPLEKKNFLKYKYVAVKKEKKNVNGTNNTK